MSTDDNAMEQDDTVDTDGDDRDEDNVDEEVDVNDGDDGNAAADDDDDDDDGAEDHDGDNEKADAGPNENEEDDEEEEDDDDDDDGEIDDGDDDASLTEGEEDLEAAVKSINERVRRGHAGSSGFDATTELHVTTDDFVRNFLSQLKMTATLDTFQTEWTEMAQKGLLNSKRFGEVPDVYVQNQRLHNELKNALREREEFQLAASTSADTLARVQKARDAQWMTRKRAGQENNRLLEETRRLKAQCHAYEPAIRRMGDKFQVLVEQTMRAALERDKEVCGDIRNTSRSLDFHPRLPCSSHFLSVSSLTQLVLRVLPSC
ncbi:sperm-associated antigen 16 protein-like [Festucalex cinctus]